jgi:hypothetical protein
MTTAKIRVVFDPGSAHPLSFEKDVEFTDLREPGGKEFVAARSLWELGKESRMGNHYIDLPSTENFLRRVTQTFHLEDFSSGAHEDRLNTRSMWAEMSHILLRVKHLLAESRSYHDEEQSYLSSDDAEAENFSWHLHLDKMERFDHAITLMGKIGDLMARLIFERLGASLIPNLDRSKPEWERAIILSAIRESLADRTGNPYVASLSDAEYAALREILDHFHEADHAVRLKGYKNRLAHRVTPSVDRPGLYTYLESRERTPITDASGEIIGSSGTIRVSRSVAEYAFLDLYADAVQTLGHYITMLERLEAIPPFGLDAKSFRAAT